MQNAKREKTKVKHKLLSFGWEPRNQVSEGAEKQKVKDVLPHKGRSKLAYSCSSSQHMAATMRKKKKKESAAFLIIMRMFSGYNEIFSPL